MACDNVALVVSVNPNVRPRGGPTPSRISTPFFKDHNALNNNESLKENYEMAKLRIREAARYRINGAIMRSKTKLISDSFSDINAKNLEKYNSKVKSIKLSNDLHINYL